MGHQYTKEEKIRAVQLYKKLGHITWVIAEIGYPSRNMLYAWINECDTAGESCFSREKKSKYSPIQRKQAVEYYLNNGYSIGKTIKALGYPGKTLFSIWLNEDLPREKRKWHCKANGTMIKFTQEQKVEVVQKYYGGLKPLQLSKEYGFEPGTVRRWAKQLLGQESLSTMPSKNKPVIPEATDKTIEELLTEKEVLEKKLEKLQKDVYHLQMQKDLLEKAGEILKKARGINLNKLSNREKAMLIDAVRNRYRLKELLIELKMSKSSYCYQECSIRKPDKYISLRERITEIFIENYSSYGYRRIYGTLSRIGCHISEKVVRRIMREEKLTVMLTEQKKYSSYKGEISLEVPNILKRNFHAESPNQKWLTDITEFHIPAGKVYLSPIIDCFDGIVVSWSIGTTPDADLVNGMLDNAISSINDGEVPIVHSDRGCHYRWPGWIDRMNAAGLTRSMSKKACSPDNSACEGFFGRVKNEMFYGKSWIGRSIEEFVSVLNDYIHWYNEKRIKVSLGYLSPLEYRIRKGYLNPPPLLTSCHENAL